jgi:hypothetical protein
VNPLAPYAAGIWWGSLLAAPWMACAAWSALLTGAVR